MHYCTGALLLNCINFRVCGYQGSSKNIVLFLRLRFFLQGLEVAGRAKAKGAAQEEWVLNNADNAFPTMETMAMEVEPAPVHLAVGMSPDQEASQLLHSNPRRCTHCASEKTRRWRRGPDGPDTVCCACG